MIFYRVHMHHWQRYEPMPEGTTFVERVEIVVEAPSGHLAAKAANVLLGEEWTVRCVMIEPVGR